jgi:hypothetical protein
MMTTDSKFSEKVLILNIPVVRHVLFFHPQSLVIENLEEKYCLTHSSDLHKQMSPFMHMKNNEGQICSASSDFHHPVKR